jgi:hypothetical protein
MELASTSGTSADTRNDVTVNANTGNTRMGFIYITYTDSYGYPCYETVMVNQVGQDITFDIYPTDMEVAPTSGTYIVNVTAGTAYSASTTDAWISLDDARDSINIKTFTVTANSGRDARVGTIDFTDGNTTLTVTVKQRGG